MSTKDYGGYTHSYGDGKVMKFDYPQNQNNVRKAPENDYSKMRGGLDKLTQAFLDEVDAKYANQASRGDSLQVNDPSNRKEYMEAVDKRYPGVNFNEIADELEAQGYEEGARFYRNLASVKDIANSGNVDFNEIADRLEADGYEEGARFYRSLASQKAGIQDSGESARAFLVDYQKLAATGMPSSKILQTLFQKHHGEITRDSLIEKYQSFGYSREEAENAIPKDFDAQLKKAREKGVNEVNDMYSGYDDGSGNNPLQITPEERDNIVS